MKKMFYGIITIALTCPFLPSANASENLAVTIKNQCRSTLGYEGTRLRIFNQGVYESGYGVGGRAYTSAPAGSCSTWAVIKQGEEKKVNFADAAAQNKNCGGIYTVQAHGMVSGGADFYTGGNARVECSNSGVFCNCTTTVGAVQRRQ